MNDMISIIVYYKVFYTLNNRYWEVIDCYRRLIVTAGK